MKTKNIFKTLAAAMLMPAMLLNTACNKEIDTENVIETENIENTAGKGYTLPVTVNVTRQADDPASKATYNESTRKLEFSEGDKLFVQGGHDTAGEFAGTLSYDTATGKFSGAITTENPYSGTAEDFFLVAYVKATLLPADYESYGFLVIDNNGTADKLYDDYIDFDDNKAFAESKAAGVAQFSLEYVYGYDDGFALEPMNAILNFTITGLAASTKVDVELSNSSVTISGSVTTDGDGTATFAMGVLYGTSIYSSILRVGGKSIFLVSSDTGTEAGKIYNITRNTLSYPIDLSKVTSAYLGSIVATNGKVYPSKTTVPTGVTAVAMIAYAGSETDHATYKHGLAIALADESGNMNWATAKSTCEGKSAITGAVWLLPSQDQWKAMFNANGGNEGSYSGLNTAITTAKGSALQEYDSYWSSTEIDDFFAWNVYLNGGDVDWGADVKDNVILVRACLVF